MRTVAVCTCDIPRAPSPAGSEIRHADLILDQQPMCVFFCVPIYIQALVFKRKTELAYTRRLICRFKPVTIMVRVDTIMKEKNVKDNAVFRITVPHSLDRLSFTGQTLVHWTDLRSLDRPWFTRQTFVHWTDLRSLDRPWFTGQTLVHWTDLGSLDRSWFTGQTCWLLTSSQVLDHGITFWTVHCVFDLWYEHAIGTKGIPHMTELAEWTTWLSRLQTLFKNSYVVSVEKRKKIQEFFQ